MKFTSSLERKLWGVLRYLNQVKSAPYSFSHHALHFTDKVTHILYSRAVDLPGTCFHSAVDDKPWQSKQPAPSLAVVGITLMFARFVAGYTVLTHGSATVPDDSVGISLTWRHPHALSSVGWVWDCWSAWFPQLIF